MFEETGSRLELSMPSITALKTLLRLPAFLVLILLLTLSLLIGVTIPAHAEDKNIQKSASQKPSLLVIASSGVRWGSLRLENPEFASLKKFFTGAALGNNLHYTGTKVTCPVAAWLTLSAADTIPLQAEKGAVNCGKMADSLVVAGSVSEGESTGKERTATVKSDRLARWRQWADTRTSNPELGTLAKLLASKNINTRAIGPGAAIGLMDGDGKTYNYHDLPTKEAALNKLVLHSLAESQLVMLDLSERSVIDFQAGKGAKGAVNRFGWPTLDRQVDGTSEKTALLINGILENLSPGQTIMLVDIAEAGATPHLGIAAYNGSGFTSGVLGSKTIRQPGLVHTVDFTQAILKFFAISPTNITDMPIQTGMSGASLESRQLFLMKQAAWADIIRVVQIPFYIGFGLLIVVVSLLAVYLVICRYRQKYIATQMQKLIPVVFLSCMLYFSASYALLALPFTVATGLENSLSSSLLQLSEGRLILHVVGISLTVAVMLSVICIVVGRKLQRWSGLDINPSLWSAALAGGFTYFAISLSIFLGSPDQLNTVVGSSGLSITRFFGINNAKYTFLVCSLMVMMLAIGVTVKKLVARGRNSCLINRAKTFMIVFIVMTVLIDGLPNLGADVGGPLALIIGALILYHRIWGLPLGYLIFIRTAAYAILSTAFFALVDYGLPGGPSTHLGGFVKSVLAGQGGRVIIHKLQAMLGTFIGNVWAMIFSLVLAVVLGGVWMLLCLRRGKIFQKVSPILEENAFRRTFIKNEVMVYVRDLLTAALSFGLLAAATNDSGALIIGCALAVIIPTVGLMLSDTPCELPHS